MNRKEMRLVILAASRADGGCTHCFAEVVEGFVQYFPALPWKAVLEEVAREKDDYPFEGIVEAIDWED